MPSEVLRELIIKLSEPDRLEIIREAGINDERPALLRGAAEDGPVEEGRLWVAQNGARILPHLLRRIDPSDDEMVELVQSGMVPFDHTLLEPREFLVRFTHPAMRTSVSTVDCHSPAVAATSLALTELITSQQKANRSFGADAGVVTHGAGCCCRLGGLSRDRRGFDRQWVGATRCLRGRRDFCSSRCGNRRPDWCDRSDVELAETKFRKGKKPMSRGQQQKPRAEEPMPGGQRADAKKIEAETIGQELENEIKRVRLGNLPNQAEAHREEKNEAPPASFFVPFALIERSSQENGLAPSHGVHLIN